MTRPNTRSKAIRERTMVLARGLARARVGYWEALLARPQFAGPIVEAVRHGVDTGSWDRRLGCLAGFGRRWRKTRRAAERDVYRRACGRASEWLATIDRDCGAANACYQAIEEWARVPSAKPWARVHRVRPPRLHSVAWRSYWARLEGARRERIRLRNAIVLANEGLVIHKCGQRGAWPWVIEEHLTPEDIQQVAREGLHRAADLFDPEKGYAFSTYAVTWIRHHVWRHHQRERSDVRYPTAIQALAYDLDRVLESNQHVEPEEARTLLLIAWDERGKTSPAPTIDTVRRAMEYMGYRLRSLDAPMGQSDEGQARTLADVLPDEQQSIDERLDQERVLAKMRAALQAMPAAERRMIEERFELGDRTRSNRRHPEAQVRRALDRLRAQLHGCEDTAAGIGR